MNIPLIKQRRHDLKLTQQDIAEACGVDRSTVANWETGSTYPDARRLKDLARKLGVTVDQLLAEPEDDQPEPEPAGKAVGQ
jgi:transcriptional regulator with XRE-family HTH domain